MAKNSPRAQQSHAKSTSTSQFKLRSRKGQIITVYRDAVTGRITSERSSDRIRGTTSRAADSLRRLAKR